MPDPNGPMLVLDHFKCTPLVLFGTTALNLFIHQDGVAADPNLACFGTAGAGNEFCGWDLHILSSGGITLDDFVPDTGKMASTYLHPTLIELAPEHELDPEAAV